jgi:hypothetical protein
VVAATNGSARAQRQRRRGGEGEAAASATHRAHSCSLGGYRNPTVDLLGDNLYTFKLVHTTLKT